MQCIIPMSTLAASPFSLTLDTLVLVRVSALNSLGTGLPSDPNSSGATLRTVPAQLNLRFKLTGLFLVEPSILATQQSHHTICTGIMGLETHHQSL
jgi:hypothetical protein